VQLPLSAASRLRKQRRTQHTGIKPRFSCPCACWCASLSPVQSAISWWLQSLALQRLGRASGCGFAERVFAASQTRTHLPSSLGSSNTEEMIPPLFNGVSFAISATMAGLCALKRGTDRRCPVVSLHSEC